MGVVVAMDGPSGSGKSSTSRGVATRLGLRYLDTGAMFRAMTWWMLEHDIDTEDADAVAAHADQPLLVSGTDPQAPTINVDGTDVAGPIRGQRVTSAVSAVSSVPRIRERLLREQRDIIGAGGIVVEGRDIGTVVAPDAEVKVYLTADPDARAVRRAAGAVRCRRRRDPAGPAAQGHHRLRSGDRAVDDGRRRPAHRHHAVHPGRGRRPGRGSRPAGAAARGVVGSIRLGARPSGVLVTALLDSRPHAARPRPLSGRPTRCPPRPRPRSRDGRDRSRRKYP